MPFWVEIIFIFVLVISFFGTEKLNECFLHNSKTNLVEHLEFLNVPEMFKT